MISVIRRFSSSLLLLLVGWTVTNPQAICSAFHPNSCSTISRSFHSPTRSQTATATALSSDSNDNNQKLDKGFNLLEIASSVVPQGKIVSGVKETWKFAWKRMMAELAPQDSKGRYTRPSYGFKGRIGSPQFPDEPGRYHLYVGNPCPVSTTFSTMLIVSSGSVVVLTFCGIACWTLDGATALSVAGLTHSLSFSSLVAVPFD